MSPRCCFCLCAVKVFVSNVLPHYRTQFIPLTSPKTLATLILIKLWMNFWLPDYIYTSTKISNVQGLFLPLKSKFNAHDVRINDATLLDTITSCPYPPVELFVMPFVLVCETKGSGSFVAAHPAKGPRKCWTKNNIFQHTVPTHLRAFIFWIQRWSSLLYRFFMYLI